MYPDNANFTRKMSLKCNKVDIAEVKKICLFDAGGISAIGTVMLLSVFSIVCFSFF